jgi:hypothetical protein
VGQAHRLPTHAPVCHDPGASRARSRRAPGRTASRRSGPVGAARPRTGLDQSALQASARTWDTPHRQRHTRSRGPRRGQRAATRRRRRRTPDPPPRTITRATVSLEYGSRRVISKRRSSKKLNSHRLQRSRRGVHGSAARWSPCGRYSSVIAVRCSCGRAEHCARWMQRGHARAVITVVVIPTMGADLMMFAYSPLEHVLSAGGPLSENVKCRGAPWRWRSPEWRRLLLRDLVERQRDNQRPPYP